MTEQVIESEYDRGYERGYEKAAYRLRGQLDFLMKEREGFIEQIRELQEEIVHLRRSIGVTEPNQSIAP